MIVLLRPYHRRIVWAIALSALVHAALLWLPHVHLPRLEDPALHPLTARLEPLPDRPKAAPAPRPPKPKIAQVAAKPSSRPAPISASAVEEALAIAASSPSAVSTPITAASAPTPSDATALPSATPVAASNKLPLLPKHAQLIFAVNRGANGMYMGEIQHRLDIIEGRYSILASTRTAGLARWFKSYNLNQSSIGTVNESGLRPESFAEEKNDSGNIQTLSASFDWSTHVLHFSEGGESPLDDGAQDSLSVLYQLALLPLNAELVDVNISNGKKLESYRLEIATNESISTSIGQLSVIHLRKLHEQGESGLEIWLAREYRLLPVKMQYLEPDGTVSATISITDIRVSDD